MLKTLVLKPSKDILSYQNYKDYPFNLFPSLILIYNGNNFINLDSRELTLLYFANKEKDTSNCFTPLEI